MLTKYPMIAVTGPRQSGKTTFCRQLCPDYQYLNMVTNQSIVEIKSGKTIQPVFFKNLKLFSHLNPTTSNCWVVYGGDQLQPRSEATVLTWRDLAGLV